MDKHIVGIESDEWVGSESEFVLKYDIPMDWDVYVGIVDGIKRFVAVTGPLAQKYDDDDWQFLGQACTTIDDTNTENLCVDERLINGINWEIWENGREPAWGIYNGNPACMNPGDHFNTHLFDPIWVGQPEMAWARLFPQLLRELEDIGFSPVYCEPNVLTRYYRVLGSEVCVSLRLDENGFIHFIEYEKAHSIEFDLAEALNPDNDSVETREELIRFVVSVSEKVIEWIDELSE